jgi:hypothetical protein
VKRVRIGLAVSRGCAEPGCCSAFVSETLTILFGQVRGSRSRGRSVFRIGPNMGIQSGTILLASLGCELCLKTAPTVCSGSWSMCTHFAEF